MLFLDLYALILGLTAIILFLLSFRFENIVAGKSVIAELGEMKNNYIFNQRINILLYGAISLSAYFFPFFQFIQNYFIKKGAKNISSNNVKLY